MGPARQKQPMPLSQECQINTDTQSEKMRSTFFPDINVLQK